MTVETKAPVVEKKDEPLPPAEPKRDANVPIGNVADALKSTVKTVDAPKADAQPEKVDESKKQPIESLAALRYHHNTNGTAPTSEEVEEVRTLENKIAEEGGKKLRVNPIEKGK